MKLLYLDSSAIAKLVVRATETGVLVALLPEWPERITSVVSRVEVVRAARRAGADGETLLRAGEVLARIGQVHMDAAVLDIAARLEHENLGTPGAIHIATALSVGEDLGAFVTYDERMAAASKAAGIETLSPDFRSG